MAARENRVLRGKLDKDRSVKMLRLISDCNKHMGGVDKNDAIVGNYGLSISHTNGK